MKNYGTRTSPLPNGNFVEDGYVRSHAVDARSAKGDPFEVHRKFGGRPLRELVTEAEGPEAAAAFERGLSAHERLEAHYNDMAASDASPTWSNGKPIKILSGTDFTEREIAFNASEPTAGLISFRARQAKLRKKWDAQMLKEGKQLSNVLEFKKPDAPKPAAPEKPKADPFETKYPFQVIEAREFAGGEFVEPEWQVHQLVPKLGTGLDLGASKSWKSFKVLEVATCIHRGTPYRDRPVRKGRSVIVVAEGSYGYPLRMKALAKHLECDVSELPAIIPAAPNLFMRDQVDALIRELKKRGCTYLAIDTKWRCSVTAEENSAKDSGIVFGAMERISQEVGCFVTAISHTGLSDGTRIRGSSSQFAAVDVEVLHERLGDIGTSTCTKLKDGPDGLVWSCKMKAIALSDKTDSLVVEHIDTPAAEKRTIKQLAGLPKTIRDTLATLAPSGTYDYREFIAAVKAKIPKAEGKDRRSDDVRKALNRTLIPDGHMFMHGEDRIGLTNIVQPATPKEDPFK